MSKATNKVRHIFNLFLLLFLVAVVTGVCVWFLTTPEARGTTFWMSIKFLAFAALLGTLFASRIVLRSNSGREIPHGFSHIYLLALYFIFVITMAMALNTTKTPTATLPYTIRLLRLKKVTKT